MQYTLTITNLKKYMVVGINMVKSIFLFVSILGLFNISYTQTNSDEIFSKGIKTVVIDPGHGGKDPGCHGAITNEKNVVLAIGLKLGEYIKKKYPNIKVIYTRHDDTFVELDQRAKIAINNKADVFISIHANSASAAASGTETYVLGLHRTESQQKVAERENSTIEFEDNSKEKYKDFDLSPDAIIARQLQLSVFLNQSISLASKVQAQFKVEGRKDRGVKQAGFLVLYKTTMPSILIETGFLTNPEEETYLHNTANQVKMANSIFRAFQEYVAEIDGVTTLVENGHGYENTIKELEKDDTKQNTVNIPIKEEKDKVYFKVQIATSQVKVALTDQRFKGVTVSEYQQDGLYKYTTGIFENDFESANELKNKMRSKGFENAFVVGFVNGERINISKAIKMAKQ